VLLTVTFKLEVRVLIWPRFVVNNTRAFGHCMADQGSQPFPACFSCWLLWRGEKRLLWDWAIEHFYEHSPRLGHEANFWYPSVRAHARTLTGPTRPFSHMDTVPRPPQQWRMPAVEAAVDECRSVSPTQPQEPPKTIETCAGASGTLPLRLCMGRCLG
jgi:hypothetical protein